MTNKEIIEVDELYEFDFQISRKARTNKESGATVIWAFTTVQRTSHDAWARVSEFYSYLKKDDYEWALVSRKKLQ